MAFHIIAATPNEKIRGLLIRIGQEVGGESPARRSDSVSARRAIYRQRPRKFIINTPSDEIFRILGHHSLILALEVKDRKAAARRAKEILEEAGIKAEIHTRAQPEFPDGFVVFLTIPEAGGIGLIFWPTTLQVVWMWLRGKLKNFPKITPWRDDQ